MLVNPFRPYPFATLRRALPGLFPQAITAATLILALTACTNEYAATQSEPSLSPLSCEQQSDWLPGSPEEGHHAVVQGVVSGLFTGADELSGLFIQDQHDAQASKSGAGLFLATPDESLLPDNLSIGDTVIARGELAPFQGGWQLHSQSILQCGEGSLNSQTLHFPVADNSELDALLHQPVRIQQPMYVVDNYHLARFGTVTLASELLWSPTQKVAPGEAAVALGEQNQNTRIVLDDGSTQEYPGHVRYPQPELHIENPLRRGDRVDELHGIIVKVGNQYHLQPTAMPQFEQHNPRPSTDLLRRQGDLRVVAFNVLNYFNGDGQGAGFPTPRGAKTQAEFERQHARLVSAMTSLDADIYTLMEVENDGFSEHSAIASLTRGLQKAMPEASWAFVDPGIDQVGQDVITQGIIYRADRVAQLGSAAINTAPVFAQGSRPPFAQRFEVKDTGGVITVVANHFKSKGSCPDDQSANANQNDGQGCWNALRTQSAEALAQWVAEDVGGNTPESFLLTGDFNAYAMEDPLQQLAEHDYVNLASLYAADGYSYVFRGEAGSLDHMMAHLTLLPAVAHFGYWSVNADEPVAFQYPFANKSAEQQENWFAPTPYRSSDHDPIWVDFNSHLLPHVSTLSAEH